MISHKGFIFMATNGLYLRRQVATPSQTNYSWSWSLTPRLNNAEILPTNTLIYDSNDDCWAYVLEELSGDLMKPITLKNMHEIIFALPAIAYQSIEIQSKEISLNEDGEHHESSRDNPLF